MFQVLSVLKRRIRKIKRNIFIKSFLKKKGNNLYVNLGCGPVNLPGFVNVDLRYFLHVHYMHSIDKLPAFDNDSVKFIYASHCLEHFNFPKIPAILAEWCRVLCGGGILRLSVPDFDKLIEIYSKSNNNIDSIQNVLLGPQTNNLFFHRAIFNRQNLEELLKGAGFSRIQEWSSWPGDIKPGKDLSVYTVNIKGREYITSLNIEAVK